MTRYHRKGEPSPCEYHVLLDDKDTKLLTYLAAILRTAEFLERGRNATIDDISAAWTDDELHLILIADEYPAVELWETERNALSLLESAFKRRVRFTSTAVPNP